jgi:hypothetical protein
MTEFIKPATIAIPNDFRFGQVLPVPRTTGPAAPSPSLGALAAFVGNWAGSGFNTIFRPDNSVTPTPRGADLEPRTSGPSARPIRRHLSRV